MTGPPDLTVITPDETPSTPPPRAKLSITAACETGERREVLLALRDRLAAIIDKPDTHPRDLCTLTLRLTEIVDALEALDHDRDQERAELRAVPDEAWDVSLF